ncbi:response regulator transcription factor [Clostridium estertheticum]|nr:response regulator transcription factor [Clostridium estertheticum]MCB2345915.1 response regulator transcription factor [Clostridium estertheticum]MCB2351173.1 response regulator transcription factor [Clostridium estertheticum]WAG47993.1 response regulator transcription factor [Clostridium estertheticum]
MILMNILLIDDHTLFAKSLEIVFQDYKEIKSFYSLQDITQVTSIIQKKQPDIILIDINLSNISNEDGLIVAKSILTNFPDNKIVMLTGYDLPVYRYEAKKIGAKGFINKNIMPENLLKILVNINNGKNHFSANVKYIEKLTRKEIQILQLLSYPYKRNEISNMLHISERTISNHIQHIFDKLEVSSSLEAVIKGINLGYIQPNYKSS